MRRVFLVLGPESSGTRLLTRILINAGCQGSDDHIQPLDTSTPSELGYSRPVWRRSVPHGHDHKWLDIDSLLSRLHGFDVHVLVTVRDRFCVEQSQLRAGHVPTLKEARLNVKMAYEDIFGEMYARDLRFTLVPYESLILGGDQAQRNLIELLGLEIPAQLIRVTDENRKYYSLSYKSPYRADTETTCPACHKKVYVHNTFPLNDWKYACPHCGIESASKDFKDRKPARTS